MYIDETSLHLGCQEIKNYALNNNYSGFIILDAKRNIHTKHGQYEQLFIDKTLIMSSDAFSQTSIYLAENVRPFVLTLINTDKITCIGGESYCYGILSKKKFVHYTNNSTIFSDCTRNAPDVENYLIDYNFPHIKTIYSEFCVLNLSKLVGELLTFLNSHFQKILIINCHEKDFQKKIGLLSNFEIISRNFIVCPITQIKVSVSLLIRKIENNFVRN